MTKWMRFGKSRQKNNTMSVAICIYQSGIALAYSATDSRDGAAVLNSEYYPFDPNINPKEKLTWLKNIIEEQGLRKAACTWVLLPSDYKSFVLNKPNVPENEQNNALKWQIKDKVSFPIEQALIDSYVLPSFNDAESKLQVFVSDESRLLQTKQLIEDSGLVLTSITIAEMALRNIASLYTQPDEVIILIHLSDTNSKLLVFYKGEIYFVRPLNMHIHQLNDEKSISENEKAYHQLSQQIQQSWEYIIRLANQTLKARVVLTPLDFKSHQLIHHLKSNVSLPIILADFNTECSLKSPLTPNSQVTCLWALGILLSPEESRHRADH